LQPITNHKRDTAPGVWRFINVWMAQRPTPFMSIVPIHRRGANVEPHDRATDPARPAQPDRVPILMRMPDLARIDGPQATLEMHAPPLRAAAPPRAEAQRAPRAQRPQQTTRRAERPVANTSTGPSRLASPRKDPDEADSDMSPPGSAKVRARGSGRRSKFRREVPSSPPASRTAAWLNPTNIMVGAAVLAVIVSIVAMVRRPATQPIDASPPGWNAGGNHPPAVNPAPAAPIGPTAVAQPEQREQASPETPAPDRAPMHSDGQRRRPGAWSNNTPEPSQAAPAPTPAPQLPLPEPDPEPGQWSTRSAMRPPHRAPVPPEMRRPFPPAAGERQPVESPGTATLTGTIDKQEQPTLRAEHERIGQGVY